MPTDPDSRPFHPGSPRCRAPAPGPLRRVRHLRTRPTPPRTNGKAAALIKTLLREWAHRCAYPSSDHRTKALPGWLRWQTAEGVAGQARRAARPYSEVMVVGAGEGIRTLDPLLWKHAGRGISRISGRGQLLRPCQGGWQGDGSDFGVSRVLRGRSDASPIVEVLDAPPTVGDEEEDVERAQRDGRHGKEVRGPDLVAVIAEAVSSDQRTICGEQRIGS